MNISKKSVLLPAVFSILSLAVAAQASAAGLYVSPASATKNVGDTITATVGVSAGGDTVYAVEGTINFDGLSCQSITVTDGVQVQSAPSCASPKFLLGLASGVTASKSLVTIVAKAAAAGSAKISVTGVDVIGAGSSLSTAGASGSYTIGSVAKVPEVKVTETKTAVTATKKTVIAPSISAATEINPDDSVSSSEEALSAETTTVSSTAAVEGEVLGGFEQNGASKQSSDWLQSTAVKVIGGLIIILIILFVGIKIGKGKK